MTNKKQTLKQLLTIMEQQNENEQFEEANETLLEIEANLDFRTKEQHEKWLDVVASYKFYEDFYDFTLSIGFKKEYKKADLWHIINRKDCAGVIVKNGETDSYWMQNANDMCFYFDLEANYNEYEEYKYKETILRKIKIAKRLFIYELAYNEKMGLPEEECLSYQEAIDYIKECYKHIICAKNEK